MKKDVFQKKFESLVEGSVWANNRGREYTVLLLVNTDLSPQLQESYPAQVVFLDQKSRVLAKNIDDFLDAYDLVGDDDGISARIQKVFDYYNGDEEEESDEEKNGLIVEEDNDDEDEVEGSYEDDESEDSDDSDYEEPNDEELEEAEEETEEDESDGYAGEEDNYSDIRSQVAFGSADATALDLNTLNAHIANVINIDEDRVKLLFTKVGDLEDVFKRSHVRVLHIFDKSIKWSKILDTGVDFMPTPCFYAIVEKVHEEPAHVSATVTTETKPEDQVEIVQPILTEPTITVTEPASVVPTLNTLNVQELQSHDVPNYGNAMSDAMNAALNIREQGK